jgi:hypothetical protein
MDPSGYVLTPALDGPDMVHLNPDESTQCGGRKWGTGTLTGDSIEFSEISEQEALELLDNKQAVACRRCGLKDRAGEIAVPEYAKGRQG